MDKIYRVFISSTYEDLIEERKEVTQALLEMNCFPTGMELFQASNDTQWDLIKKVIDSCDYYIVIVAGRYGSIHSETKKSYTQMEYEYALSADIPVLGFIRRDLSKLPHDKVDDLTLVNRFIEIVKQKEVKYWSNSHELAGVVSRAMHHAMEDYPRVGWVRDAIQIYDKDITNIVKRILLDREFSPSMVSTDRESQIGKQEVSRGGAASAEVPRTGKKNIPQPRAKNLERGSKTSSNLYEDSRLIKYSGSFLLDQMKSSALKEMANIVLSAGITALSDIFTEFAFPGLPSFSFYEDYNLLNEEISDNSFTNVIFDIWGNRLSGCVIVSMPNDALTKYYINQVKELSLRLGSKKEIENFKQSMVMELGSQFSGSCTTAIAHFANVAIRMGKSDFHSVEELFDSNAPVYVGALPFNLKRGASFMSYLLLDIESIRTILYTESFIYDSIVQLNRVHRPEQWLE